MFLKNELKAVCVESCKYGLEIDNCLKEQMSNFVCNLAKVKVESSNLFIYYFFWSKDLKMIVMVLYSIILIVVFVTGCKIVNFEVKLFWSLSSLLIS